MEDKPSKSRQRYLRRGSRADETTAFSSGQTSRKVNRGTRVVQRTLESTHLGDDYAVGNAEEEQRDVDAETRAEAVAQAQALRKSIQKIIDAEKLPAFVSIFVAEDANTPGKLFDLGSCKSLEAIKELVDNHFSPNLRKLNCPSQVTFRALNCFHPGELAHRWGGRAYVRGTEDKVYQVWYKSVLKLAATTGQVVRIQVCLWSDQVDCKWNKNKEVSTHAGTTLPNLDFATYTDGAAWLLKQLSTNNPAFLKGEYFEVLPELEETRLWPIYRFREAMAVERLVEEMASKPLAEPPKLTEKRMKQKSAELDKIRDKNEGVIQQREALLRRNKALDKELVSSNDEIVALKARLEDLKKQLRRMEGQKGGVGEDEAMKDADTMEDVVSENA